MNKFLLLLRSENIEEENRYYIRAIEMLEGEVVFVRDTDSYDVVLQVLDDVVGILLRGGYDVGRLDYFLISYAVYHQVRVLGICHGVESVVLWNSNNHLVSIGGDAHHQKEGYVNSVSLEDSR